MRIPNKPRRYTCTRKEDPKYQRQKFNETHLVLVWPPFHFPPRGGGVVVFNDIHPVDGVAIHCIVLTALDFLDTFCRLLLFEDEKRLPGLMVM